MMDDNYRQQQPKLMLGINSLYSCHVEIAKILRKFVNMEKIQCHLITRGFMKDYTILSKHWEVGEDVPQKTFDDVMEKPANLLRWHGKECKKDKC
jgi:hypothetical protein